MKKKIIGIVAVLALLVGSVGLYMFNMPHRNVKDIEPEFHFNSSELAYIFINDRVGANAEFLSENGDSKVGVVYGNIVETGVDKKGATYAVIRNEGEPVGVQCAFTEKLSLEEGTQISVKGVIRSGAEFDEDFEEYIDVIMEQCTLETN